MSVLVQTVEQLNIMLDVEKPFTILLHDRTGISEIRPDDGVRHSVESAN